tara:strand:- start:843 stop:1082 length:240 start_codon:yes stop_codon:yes gene_type:complete
MEKTKINENEVPQELKAFREKWKQWNQDEKLDALINMTMSVAYRMDILASVVSGLPEVQKMENAAKDAIKKAKESSTPK